MTKKLAAAFLICISSISGFAQMVHHVSLTQLGKDKRFETSKIILPVFKLENNQLHEYQGFGVIEDEKPKVYTAKLPPILNAIDTGYTYLYSNINTDLNNGFTPVLVLNYSRRLKPAVIFIDHNRNYDFTDDGDPDTFQFVMNHINVRVKNPLDTLQHLSYRIERFSFVKDRKFKQLANEFFKMYAGPRTYVGTDYSFRERRYQSRTALFGHGQDSFRITLYDGNSDGFYTDPENDRILLDVYSSELASQEHSFPVCQPGQTCYFERNFRSFKVTEIDPYGRSIQFYYDPEMTAQRQLMDGNRVPDLTFYDHKEEKHKLRWYRRKPMYVYFWNKKAEGFQEDTAALRMIQEKFCPMIKIVALNYGDNPEILGKFVKYNEIQWLNGIATKSMIEEYRIEEVPFGFLLKKRCVLYKKGLRPAEVLQMLESGEIQSW